ncbi:hypothetical protein M569_10790, partial [Genlisea aurea]
NQKKKITKMATRRLTCSRCGRPNQVPAQARTFYCEACYHVNDNSGYYYYDDDYFNAPQNHSGSFNGYYHQRPDHQQSGSSGMIQVPYHHQPMAPPVHGRKRALLCGISYKDLPQSLKGSINDVLSMKRLLVERFGFPTSSIIVLTEEGDYYHVPTKKNIRAALRWLVQGCRSGDSLVFHYSGHGSQVRDKDGDEVDGYDETLMPVDYQTEGRILDDEINATVVRPLPSGATLHCIIDTCFSGTFMDLPNICRMNRDGYYKWEDQQRRKYKGTSGGFAISFSACDDHQNSGDTTAFTGSDIGALTYSFIQALRQNSRVTYAHMLTTIRQKIGQARKEMGFDSNDPRLSQ